MAAMVEAVPLVGNRWGVRSTTRPDHWFAYDYLLEASAWTMADYINAHWHDGMSAAFMPQKPFMAGV